MKVNKLESLYVNSLLRRFIQKYWEMPTLLKLGGDVNIGPIAEIGCGSGYGLKLISQQMNGFPVHGYEIDEAMLRNACSYLANDILDRKIFIHAEDDNLTELQKSHFSSIFSFGALHHIPYWQKALSRTINALDENGKIYLWEFYRPFTMNKYVKKFLYHPEEAAFTHGELLAELNKHGCKVLGEKNFMNMAGMVVVQKQPKPEPRF